MKPPRRAWRTTPPSGTTPCHASTSLGATPACDQSYRWAGSALTPLLRPNRLLQRRRAGPSERRPSGVIHGLLVTPTTRSSGSCPTVAVRAADRLCERAPAPLQLDRTGRTDVVGVELAASASTQAPMFILISIPFGDLRPLIKGEQGRVAAPDWTSVEPQSGFVRGFGKLAARNSRSYGLLGERFFADFNNAVRLRGALDVASKGWPRPLNA